MFYLYKIAHISRVFDCAKISKIKRILRKNRFSANKNYVNGINNVQLAYWRIIKLNRLVMIFFILFFKIRLNYERKVCCDSFIAQFIFL